MRGYGNRFSVCSTRARSHKQSRPVSDPAYQALLRKEAGIKLWISSFELLFPEEEEEVERCLNTFQPAIFHRYGILASRLELAFLVPVRAEVNLDI